jgi:hypothetical protein
VEIPARGRRILKHAQGHGSRPQVPLRGLACEVGALGVQPGRSTGSLAGARTVDCSNARSSMQSGDAPSSSMSERFVGDGLLRLSGRSGAPIVGGMTAPWGRVFRSGNPCSASRGRVVFGETSTARLHVCPARSIHRDTGCQTQRVAASHPR